MATPAADPAALPTAVLTARFSEAVRWASHLHADQCRKGTQIPYVAHLFAVASLVLEDGGVEEEAIAGVLHDVIEDCGASAAEIRARFGGTVAEIVVACTDDGGARDATDWKHRKQTYLEHLERDDLPPGALRVSAADKLHNARSILSDLHEHGGGTWDRFNAGADDQRWYYTELVRVLTARHDSVVTRELARVVDELTAWIEAAAEATTPV
ncbi:MAG TPA: HD domain-containing protein [Acidimicrobiia bacterium]|nr:HD domain-containing protein [Acidimicrobiia bacterium]